MGEVTAAATFCATLVDEWVRAGVTDAVVCPGSRSTPMAVALATNDAIRVHVHHDERSAGFIALGLGLATDRPAIVLTTSGTAAAELHPAIVEAGLSRVPLIACTADRPPELRDVGAPQTIDQTHLYGRSVRWFHDPGVPDASIAGTWRSLGSRAVAEATGLVPGPVHLNLPFREPLIGDAGPLPPGRSERAPWTRRVAAVGGAPKLELAGRRGVIVAGAGAPKPSQVHALADALGWPVLADPRSGSRLDLPATVAHADAILRVEHIATDLRPDVVLRLGQPPASRVVGEWLAATGAEEITIASPLSWPDASASAALLLSGELGAPAAPETPVDSGEWLARWRAADDAARHAIHDVLVGAPASEPAIARQVLASLPDDATLVVSSSMPVRDVEWYAHPRDGVRVLANRGANGIDGVLSTAVGVALGSGPTAALIGDVAFLHDTNALLGLAGRGVDLAVIVIDNDGGGIFSFLPQASVLAGERFEQLFGTPHGVDLAALAAAHHIQVEPAVDAALKGTGVRMAIARTDRAENVGVHAKINDAVRAALTT